MVIVQMGMLYKGAFYKVGRYTKVVVIEKKRYTKEGIIQGGCYAH